MKVYRLQDYAIFRCKEHSTGLICLVEIIRKKTRFQITIFSINKDRNGVEFYVPLEVRRYKYNRYNKDWSTFNLCDLYFQRL